MNTPLCPWNESSLLFFSENVPALVHYSHTTAIIAAVSISVLIFINQPRDTVARLFLLFSFIFSAWTVIDMILWATNQPSLVMFLWSLQIPLEALLFVTAFYLYYYFTQKSWPSYKINTFILFLVFPILILLPTQLTLTGLYLDTCESDEGFIAMYYSYFVNAALITLILITAYFHKIQTNTKIHVNRYFLIGLITFLLTFTVGNLLSSMTDDWTISQYGLFSMPVFALLIAYAIVQYNAFNIKLISAQLFVTILSVLVGSLIFIVQSTTAIAVATITFIFSLIAGYFLVKGVKREVSQKGEIEKLLGGLARANRHLQAMDKQKSEFVSIASHQLRSPLTAIRGYASMLTDGSYGQVPQKARRPLEIIEESARMMALSIEDYLNVSRIEAGNMKFDFEDFNLAADVQNIVDGMRAETTKLGLLLMYRSEISSKGIIYADRGKVEQIIYNLLNNSIKYTPKGSITVFVHDSATKKKIYVEIIDTGIGMSEETMDILFQKFKRAENANHVNVHGTGLGLYVAKRMAVYMKGDIAAHSDGDNKGSRFILELPLKL